MLDIKMILTAILIACVVFISCDRSQEMLDDVMVSDAEMMDTAPMDSEEEMMDADPMAEILASYEAWPHAQPLPPPRAEFTDPAESGSAHGLGRRIIYPNETSHIVFRAIPATNAAGGTVVFPAGTAIVKEIMDDTNSFVWRRAVMLKTDDPMYADHNGWQYVQYQRESEADPFVAQAGDGTERGSAGCHGCHAKAEYDSVFIAEIFLEVGAARLAAQGEAPGQ